MKIAMLTNNYKPFVGGVPISVERQAVGMAELGHDVTVFAPQYDMEEKEEERFCTEDCRGSLRVIRLSTGRCLENGMVIPKLMHRELVSIFQKEGFDLIHTHHPMIVGPAALYLGKKFDIPVIYTYHTRYEDYLHYLHPFRPGGMFPKMRKKFISLGREKIVPGYMRWFTNQCDMVFAPTAGMLKRMRLNGTQVPVAVLPTGLEDKFYIKHPEKAKEIRQRYISNEEGLLFCTAGRLEAEKNPEFLLQGIWQLKRKLRQEFKLLFIGDGSMRKELEQKAKQLDIQDVVCFAGNIPNEELNQYLQACDLFLFASKSETQGIVLAEAMASGCPVVAVRASGVEDIVQDGVNGFAAEEDAGVWADKVMEIIHSGKLQEMGRRAKASAEGFRASGLASYEELLYRQCIIAKYMEEDIGHAYTTDGKEIAPNVISGIFKAS